MTHGSSRFTLVKVGRRGETGPVGAMSPARNTGRVPWGSLVVVLR